MKSKRMIMSNELASKIKDAKNVLEEIADSNNITDVTAEWLYDLCELLDEVC
jgi:DNA-binding Xre family transcriptional regulator